MREAAPITNDQVRAFVLAGHGNLEQVQSLLAENPALLDAAYAWQENDRETAIQGAAHVGNAAIAEYLLAQGAPLEICTAAMLGRRADVERLLQADPQQIAATGAHGIPLLAHAALSGDRHLVGWLVERGAHAGMSAALHNAVGKGHADLTRWLLENGNPDLGMLNFQGQTPLAVARARGLDAIAGLLLDHGASQ
jgi:ankyrin repeat protein